MVSADRGSGLLKVTLRSAEPVLGRPLFLLPATEASAGPAEEREELLEPLKLLVWVGNGRGGGSSVSSR